jgi:hypothetical protein
MVNLPHISKDSNYFVFMGTKITEGREHDKNLGKELVDNFVKNAGEGKIKLLIADRGFLERHGTVMSELILHLEEFLNANILMIK